VDALGSIYLGGAPVTGMARVGRVKELSEGSARLAERMFRSERPPFCTSHF